ncbi:MAG: hypothetical protein KDE56_18540 [Anaerolineales bacterium]|nr:hypothetical protein [Anaerolineales bacterium]
MGRRTIAILFFIFGILLLIIISVLFINSQDRTNQTPTTTETTLDSTETPLLEEPQGLLNQLSNQPDELVEVVVSFQTVPRGWQMTEAELRTDLRKASDVQSNVVTKIEDVVGLYARTDIFQGQTLTRDMFVGDPTLASNNEFGPSSIIPAGFVAQAVPMDRLSSVAYGLAPGDYVDIMLSFVLLEIDEEFQTLLDNSATFYLRNEEGAVSAFVVDPFGRVETLPTNERTLIAPTEGKRPLPVSIILQNARVIQVGAYVPPPPVQAATPTAVPVETEGDATPTPAPDQPTVTPTPFPDVLLVAMAPQEQLLLKYAVEANANIDFALRGINDGQLYSVENVDLPFILNRFGIDIPANFNYTASGTGSSIQIITPTPAAPQGESGPEGG